MPNVTHQIQAITIGKFNIQQNELWVQFTQRLTSRCAGFNGRNVQTTAIQILGIDGTEARTVFDNEGFHASSASCGYS